MSMIKEMMNTRQEGLRLNIDEICEYLNEYKNRESFGTYFDALIKWVSCYTNKNDENKKSLVHNIIMALKPIAQIYREQSWLDGFHDNFKEHFVNFHRIAVQINQYIETRLNVKLKSTLLEEMPIANYESTFVLLKYVLFCHYIWNNTELEENIKKCFGYEIDGDNNNHFYYQNPIVAIAHKSFRPISSPNMEKTSISTPNTPIKAPTPIRPNSPTKSATPPNVGNDPSSRPNSPMKSSTPTSFPNMEDASSIPTTSTKSKTPSRANTPIESNSPIKSPKPINTPDMVKDLSRPNSPIKSSKPSRANTPTESNSPTKSSTPINAPDMVKASSRPNSPIKSPTPARANTPLNSSSNESENQSLPLAQSESNDEILTSNPSDLDIENENSSKPLKGLQRRNSVTVSVSLFSEDIKNHTNVLKYGDLIDPYKGYAGIQNYLNDKKNFGNAEVKALLLFMVRMTKVKNGTSASEIIQVGIEALKLLGSNFTEKSWLDTFSPENEVVEDYNNIINGLINFTSVYFQKVIDFRNEDYLIREPKERTRFFRHFLFCFYIKDRHYLENYLSLNFEDKQEEIKPLYAIIEKFASFFNFKTQQSAIEKREKVVDQTRLKRICKFLNDFPKIFDLKTDTGKAERRDYVKQYVYCFVDWFERFPNPKILEAKDFSRKMAYALNVMDKDYFDGKFLEPFENQENQETVLMDLLFEEFNKYLPLILQYNRHYLATIADQSHVLDEEGVDWKAKLNKKQLKATLERENKNEITKNDYFKLCKFIIYLFYLQHDKGSDELHHFRKTCLLRDDDEKFICPILKEIRTITKAYYRGHHYD